MAYVPLVEHPKGVVPKLAAQYARRRFGRDVEPVGAASHHSGVLVAGGLLETAAEKGWHKLDRHLVLLAVQASAGAIGCSWCIDFGYYEGLQKGLDPAKVRDVPRWRDSDVYDDRERAVLEYAEAATATPAAVTDETGGPAAVDVQRRRDRRAGLLGRPRKLSVSLQRRPRAAQPGFFRQLPGARGVLTAASPGTRPITVPGSAVI